MKKGKLKVWKYPSILLGSVGIAGIGDFIYLVAINLLVFQMTGSAAAVAGLWIVGPVVNVLTKFWTGSFIDYRSKRKIMIGTYIARALLVASLPFMPHVWGIYMILVFISIAKSFFAPSSITYITQLVPEGIRKRYNSIQSMAVSGAFIVGPAVAGALILIGSIDMALFVNAAAFLIAALLLSVLPETARAEGKAPALSLGQIKADWVVATGFLRKQRYIAFIYSAYLLTMVFSFAMDAQEVVFTQDVVGLSEVEYSLLISITGVGAIAGALMVSIFSNRLSIRYMIAIGISMEAVGYLIYAASWSFLSIAVGFTILGFFNAFINAGITTFYQNNIPVELMGRVTSIFQLLQSALIILFVLAVGAAGDLISLRMTIVALSIVMLLLAIFLVGNVLNPVRKAYFREAAGQGGK